MVYKHYTKDKKEKKNIGEDLSTLSLAKALAKELADRPMCLNSTWDLKPSNWSH